MHPHLIELGPLTIQTYGTMMVLAFLAAMWLARRRAPAHGVDPETVFDLGFWLLLAGLGGAKLLYWVVTLPELLAALGRVPNQPGELLRLLSTGFVFYGGLIGAVVAGVIIIRRRGLDLWQTFDLLAPSAILGLGIGRIGCLSAGCCYGKPCDLPWAITFRHPDAVAPPGIPRHPTQIYEMLACFAIAAVLLIWSRHRRFEGQIFWLMVGFYSTARFVIELFRGDPRGRIDWLGLSTSQAIGLVSLAVAVGFLIWLPRRRAS